MKEKPSITSNLNKSAELSSLPAIWKGKIESLRNEVKALNVTHEDTKPYKRASKQTRDDLLSDYYSEKKKLVL